MMGIFQVIQTNEAIFAHNIQIKPRIAGPVIGAVVGIAVEMLLPPLSVEMLIAEVLQQNWRTFARDLRRLRYSIYLQSAYIYSPSQRIIKSQSKKAQRTTHMELNEKLDARK